MKIVTADLELPSGKEVNEALQSMVNDPTLGMRISRKEYESQIAERNTAWHEEPQAIPLDQTLAATYRRKRGKQA